MVSSSGMRRSLGPSYDAVITAEWRPGRFERYTSTIIDNRKERSPVLDSEFPEKYVVIGADRSQKLFFC